MKRAVIYARYSSDKQREESIDAQVRACNLPEFAELRDVVYGRRHGKLNKHRQASVARRDW